MGDDWCSASDPPVVLQQRYRLTAILGKGRLGTTYRASDTLYMNDVVIKYVDPTHRAEQPTSASFIHELQIAQHLTHPQIVAVHSLAHESGWSYLVLELAPERTLRGMLRERGQLRADEALELTHHLITAIADLHAQGILHRHLKPENLLITADGHLKLMEVGLGLARADPRLQHPSMQRNIYQAPEMISAGTATIESDLYAVGAIWYELLTGQPPAPNPNTHIAALRALGTPTNIEQIIMQLLAAHPNGRYRSAEATLHALAQISRSGHHQQLDLSSSVAMEAPPRAHAAAHHTDEEGIVAAVEAERKHLANLLQQQVAEPLHLLLAQANTYEQSLSGQPLAQMAVSVLATLARQVLQQLRDLEADLDPQVLETLGLAPALDLLAGQYMRSTSAQIRLFMDGGSERLRLPRELALFRATQAALMRAIQAAHATHITIRLERHTTHVRYSVHDNGISAEIGHALHSACQRIEQVGGTVDIALQQSGGCVFNVLFPHEVAPILTPREREVLQILAEGCSNKQIATRLMVSARTVNFHLDNIFAKLHVNTRTEASLMAIRMGWVDPGIHKS
jgi:DNA-binding NarL/FixJ family response regulator